MASVAGISLDEPIGGVPITAAVAFSLKVAPRKSRVRTVDDWQVEIRSGVDFIIARTTKELAFDVLVDDAIGAVHHSLDLTSVEDFDHLVTVSPVDDQISFRREGDRTLVRYCSVVDFQVNMDVSFQIGRADGTIEVPVQATLKWTPALRFYRLSQSTPDLFDAFRNLYLSLEALLDQFWPKRSDEYEKEWLHRALAEAGKKVNFGQLATSGIGDPLKEVAGRIYSVRVHLFHAKTGRTLIPDEAVSYSKVARVYRTLFSLWTEIFRCWITVRRTGGTMTYTGFRRAVEGGMASTYLSISEDDTIAGPDDQASPKGMPVFRFPGAINVFESRPGNMMLSSEAKVSELAITTIGRILICDPSDKLVIVNSIKGCLDLSGVEKFEFMNLGRLMNKVQPRVGI